MEVVCQYPIILMVKILLNGEDLLISPNDWNCVPDLQLFEQDTRRPRSTVVLGLPLLKKFEKACKDL